MRRCLSVGEALELPAIEVIVVDDGSRDHTRVLVDAIAQEDARVRSIHHPRNRGYGAALRSGLLAARMERVFFTDADLQFDVAEVGLLLRHAQRYGVVAGYRSPRRDPWVRRLAGWTWTRLVGTLFDLHIRDVDCAFKVFDRRLFERIDIRSIGALINTEILVRARAEGFEIIEVPVSHFPRVAGQQSGLHPRVVGRALIELWTLHDDLRSVALEARAVRGS